MWRRDYWREWFGQDPPPRETPIIIDGNPDGRPRGDTGGGMTQFTFRQNGLPATSGKWEGSEQQLISFVIPHECCHIVLAERYNQALPRWFDEGFSTNQEAPSMRKKMNRMLGEFLTTGRGIPFNIMFTAYEYPGDVLPLYAQSTSVVDFLRQQKGDKELLSCLETALGSPVDGRWTNATRVHYGYQSLGHLQQDWLSWVRVGSPEASEQGLAWDGQSWGDTVAVANGWGAQQKPSPTVTRGPQGPQGPAGPQGPPGDSPDIDEVVRLVLARIPTPTVEIDYDQLTEEVRKRLPPIQIRYLDGNGNETQSFSEPLGTPISLPAIRVQNYDKNDRMLDSELYPLNGPIKIRYGAN